MGFQIPGPTKGKVDHLIATHGAEGLNNTVENTYISP
jgi:hypothetical protein